MKVMPGITLRHLQLHMNHFLSTSTVETNTVLSGNTLTNGFPSLGNATDNMFDCLGHEMFTN